MMKTGQAISAQGRSEQQAKGVHLKSILVGETKSMPSLIKHNIDDWALTNANAFNKYFTSTAARVHALAS